MNKKLCFRQTGIAVAGLLIHLVLSNLIVFAAAFAMNYFKNGTLSFDTGVFSSMSQSAYLLFDSALTIITMGAAIVFLTRLLPRRSYYERPIGHNQTIFFALFFAALYLSLYINYYSTMLFGKLGASWAEAVMPQLSGPLSVVLVLVRYVLLPAFIEELLFRGALLRTLLPLGELEAAVAVSMLFAVFHGSADQWLGIMLVSFVFSYAAIKTSSIIPSMVMHFLNNLIAVSLSYLTIYGYSDTTRLISYGITVLGFGGALYYYFTRASVANKALGRNCGVLRVLLSPLLIILGYGIVQTILLLS